MEQTWKQLLVGAKNFRYRLYHRLTRVDSNIILIGTGEGNLSADSYYRCWGLCGTKCKSGHSPSWKAPIIWMNKEPTSLQLAVLSAFAVDPKNDDIVFFAPAHPVMEV